MIKRISTALMFILLWGSLGFSADILEVRSAYLEAAGFLAGGNLSYAEAGFFEVLEFEDFTNPEDQLSLERYRAKSYYYLGDIEFMRENYEESIDYYQYVAQYYDDSDIYARALYKLGRSLVMNGDFASGMAILYDYLGKYEDIDDLADNALYFIGRGYTGQGDYQSAIDALSLLLTDYPDSPLAFDVRSSISNLEELMAIEEASSVSTDEYNVVVDEYQLLLEENQRLAEEKALLESISDLLLIKQRLLEIKQEKVDLLADIRALREGEE